jgi:hypothetical protein
MLDRERAAAARASLALAVVLLVAPPVWAYGGPGPGVEFIGYFMALLAWLGMCFAAVVLWPIYAAVRKIRGRKKPAQEAPQPLDTAPPAEPASAGK